MRHAKLDSKTSRLKIQNRYGREEEKRIEMKKRKMDTAAGETNGAREGTDKAVRKVDRATSN
jgi:hypothetical protein